MKRTFFILAAVAMLSACNSGVKSKQVLVTSEAGQKCSEAEAVVFKKTTIDNVVVINRADKRQQIDGFGNSITESSAFVLACLTPERRHAVLQEMYGAAGANFSASRTVIGSSDFTVEGNYSYDDVWNDRGLDHFSLDVHKDGFSKEKYPQVKDEHYDVNQLLHEIADIKHSQTDKEWRLVGSPWTAPAWMKDNGMFYDNKNRRGGALLKERYQTFADYFAKYLEAYQSEGISFWAVTPENEPMGNDGSWESMDMSPQAEAEFIGKYLGPTLSARGFQNVNILGFDQNTFEAGPYTAVIYGDTEARDYTDGMALHWYGSTISCFPEVLDSLHALYPDKRLFHTEGCVDNLGRDPWSGVSDPIGFKESGWFGNDSFWWNNNATDWAYSTPFWPEWHPAYSPVHRYAQYIIDGVNHWLTGYIDWNMALDSVGGPTHVGNNCGAMVMIDYENDNVYFTPYYYAMKQLSRSMRPGDVVLGITEPADPDLHICAVEKPCGCIAINALNMSKEEKRVPIQIGEYAANVALPANSVETILVKL